MNYARKYENLLNFVNVMPKILVVPFFSRHGVNMNNKTFCEARHMLCLALNLFYQNFETFTELEKLTFQNLDSELV